MKQSEQAKPFFAQFLEAQQAKNLLRPNEANQLVWPPVSLPIIEHDQTMKYPSDGDDDWPAS
ncbi:microviridin/marinostatin family tricyclic proteinase inhibitor [Pseudoflavitalea sp. X16]|uniref:microviridin/marinostatin family tricyclic proteinase inhibitor n=1 Tax=Paraflavitalea devenefica TaxID=2716334 RepID=UPI001422DD24|nr:microviridin/marinostatin family tricyclic proteinase inhibitor [Paraflavitalea devenefica]NII28609.1 microviridin/marinostatin family tricyclic proteinase inhibitor [Paraflavitalea devenefica]